MSRGNILQGQASGKLGDTVLMVRNGQQLQRVYTKAGARSGSQASEAARIQRVKFGSASNQWQLYRYVCTRMYRKGRKSTQSDYNYFVKRNASLLPYFTKQENADGVHVLQPGIFSDGNLGRIDLLHYFRTTLSESASNLVLYDSNVDNIPTTRYTQLMSVFKSVMAKAYPRARKLTYLFSYANEFSIEEEGETFQSQQITHDIVTVDLYAESTAGENSQTIAEYFSDRIKSEVFAQIIGNQSLSICLGNGVFYVKAGSESDVTFLSGVAVLLFATDENVSDVYTTELAPQSVDPTVGPYALYSAYRTTESLRVAADSYGYQSGVMRDEVAALGNDLSDAVTAYAKRLKAVSADAHADFMRRIGSPEEVKPVEVRKTTAEKKEG